MTRLGLGPKDMKKSSLNVLRHKIDRFDEAVDSGSAGRLLAAGIDLRNAAIEVAQLHS